MLFNWVCIDELFQMCIPHLFFYENDKKKGIENKFLLILAKEVSTERSNVERQTDGET